MIDTVVDVLSILLLIYAICCCFRWSKVGKKYNDLCNELRVELSEDVSPMQIAQTGTERMDRWICAKKRKPKDPEVVVLCIVSGKAGSTEFDNAIQLGTYEHEYDEWIIEGWELYSNLNVSYWMPLPEMPWEEDEP